jgi:hypothetical protein
MNRQFEREEEQLEQDLADGLITQKEYNAALRDMRDHLIEEANQAADDAFHQYLGRWR